MSTICRTRLDDTTPVERLAGALVLAITAPTDALAAEVIDIADWLAVGLSDAEVESAKAAALSKLQGGAA